jgi:serine phosphatase RsbU (regulator of sigma subunit)
MIAQLANRPERARGDTIVLRGDGPIVSRHALAFRNGSEGGDWSEAFALSETQLAISMGDVCGHDAKASSLMARLRREVRFEALLSDDPASVLSAVNASLCHRGWSTYATAIFGVIDLKARTLAFASAGHPAPFVVEPLRSRVFRARVPRRRSMPLGVAASLALDVNWVQLSPGTLVVFYTDGVTEIEHDARVGERRLRAAVHYAYGRPGADSASAIAHYIDLAGRRRDDASIITVRMRP